MTHSCWFSNKLPYTKDKERPKEAACSRLAGVNLISKGTYSQACLRHPQVSRSPRLLPESPKCVQRALPQGSHVFRCSHQHLGSQVFMLERSFHCDNSGKNKHSKYVGRSEDLGPAHGPAEGDVILDDLQQQQ